jgi:hypothetical protein
MIETITDWIDFNPLTTHVMDYIKFNKKIINYYFYLYDKNMLTKLSTNLKIDIYLRQ